MKNRDENGIGNLKAMGDCRSCAAGRGTTGHGGRGGREGREGREGRDVEARDVRDVRDVTVVRSMKKRVCTQTLGSRDLKDALSELKNKCCVLDGLLLSLNIMPARFEI